jgi:hypothetical protein
LSVGIELLRFSADDDGEEPTGISIKRIFGLHIPGLLVLEFIGGNREDSDGEGSLECSLEGSSSS